MREFLRLTFYLLGLGLLLQGCVPQSDGGGKRRGVAASNQGGTTEDDRTPDQPNFTSSSQLYWFSSGLEIPSNLIINENTSQVVYLRGSAVHTFLSQSNNSSQVFCLVANYNETTSGAKQQLRVRALPISFTNLSQGSIERLFRIDIALKTDNQSLCGGDAYRLSATQSTPQVTTPLVNQMQAAFAPPDLCPNCSGVVVSTNVSLYRTTSLGSGNREIRPENWLPLSELDLRGLGLRVDVQSNVSDDNNTCTNSGCQAKGFDCCLQGQCVNDRTERPNAVNSPQYATAMADVQANPANFLNYPEIFYICPNMMPPVDDDDEPLPDADADADALFQRDLEDFYCLEEGKKDQPEFASLGLPRCQDQAAYIQVRTQVWDRCGCEADPFPGEPDDPVCPDFGLRALLNAQGQIQQVVCDIPDDQVEPTPFQSLDVRVSNRSAPHRFFDQDGRAHDKIEDLRLTLPTPEQEGEPFSYLDESGKTDPLDSPFSMNAILGPFTTTLSKAIPAKVVYVEFDQTYVISARSGFYTPCPMCSKDSWFEAFTAYPPSQRGSGLQAQGYSTSRDSYSGNNTNGNYEDTIFGRACWVPPTMIPFTHRPFGDLATQRRARYETQAALFVNGYQRDWFGFNKGALIGSFDGVKWFAIGKGRRVQSTSQRLFLAINAPFADLSENTDTIVEIVSEQLGFDSVAEMDYDTEIELSDERQNSGGTCQFYHQCEVDSDCVAKLGWEYACASINAYRTSWPRFDINGNELVGEEIANANFTRFLQGPFPEDNGKRCVYRGAGSICKRDFESGIDPSLKKHLTCAPNFYCASLGDTSFNTRVVREPASVESILFGQGAKVLGRPQSYIGAMDNLTDTIRGNIEHNAEGVSSLSADFGICRPGRTLATTNAIEQHRTSDNQRRTDYISQIGSCDANALGNQRTIACPAIETRPGQPTPVGDFITSNSAADQRQRVLQNMCGGEAKRQLSTGLFESTFKAVEANPLSSLVDLLSPTLARDACLRRAGSICHTDLDCSPNKLHAEQALFFGVEAFGGTSAEKSFWTEELVCSQPRQKPFLINDDYFDFDMSENRCCRELGKDLTMYTQVNSLPLAPDIGTDNLGLVTNRLASDDPRQIGRYSRYAVVDLGAAFPAPRVQSTLSPTPNQWKTINKTGELNCCGGGFIRKFADGTNDWTNPNRFRLAPENFACLNYSNYQVFGHDGFSNINNYNRDYDRLCRAPAMGGCIQVTIPEAEANEFIPPSLYAGIAELTTDPQSPPSEGDLIQEYTNQAPYQPIPYRANNPASTHVDMTFEVPPVNYILDATFSPGTSFYLPLYITGASAIVGVRINYYDEEGASLGSIAASPYLGNPICPSAGWENPRESMAAQANSWCIGRDGYDQFDVMNVRADSSYPTAGEPFAYAGVSIFFQAPGTTQFSANVGGPQGLNPGNEMYYLTKLGRFELLGIPQIFYEPLYCNLDMDTLVPGIFRQSTRAGFDANSIMHSGTNLRQIFGGAGGDVANPNNRIVYQDQINHSPVFSGHEFKCCQKLGQVVSSADQCCSGFTVQREQGQVCMLPSGVDLHVYFNRFVSSEGVGSEEPGGGLIDDDFIPETGEPKYREATLTKIAELGFAYCASENVRFGSTTNFFYAEPFAGFYEQDGGLEESRIHSFVDSTFDTNQNSDDGYTRFQEGLKWTHHLYCD